MGKGKEKKFIKNLISLKICKWAKSIVEYMQKY